MKRLTFFIALVSLIAASTAVMAGTGPVYGADPSQAFEVSGTVLAVTGGSGSGMPMLTVDDASMGHVDVALCPIWFLQKAEFSVEVGDSVHLLAYPCPTCAASAVAAWVENLTKGTSIELRDEDGHPLWTQRQPRRATSARLAGGGGSGGQNAGGQGAGSGDGSGTGQPGGSGNGTGNGPAYGSGLDMSQVATATGVVVEFTGYGSADQPVLTLEVETETVDITVSPYQPILAAGLVIEPGLILTVTFAPTECAENPHNVAISILDDATGVLVQLRDPESGFPMTGGGGGHNRPNWP
jgi:hypothetical protein